MKQLSVRSLELVKKELDKCILICSNCHNKIHAGSIEIVGLFPSTKKPYSRTLIYNEGSKINELNLKEPYFKSKPQSMKVFYEKEQTDERKDG